MAANTMMFSVTAFAVTACAGLALVGGYLALAAQSRHAGFVREWQVEREMAADVAAVGAMQDLTNRFATRPSEEALTGPGVAARQAFAAQGGLAALGTAPAQSVAPTGPQISRPAPSPNASVRLLDLSEAMGD